MPAILYNQRPRTKLISVRLSKPIVRISIVAMLATHAFFLWSVRGGIRRADPDFTVFYTAARTLRAGLGSQLYEPGTQRAVQLEFASNSDIRHGALPYIHPPFEALLFVPFTFLRYSTAFLLWNLLNLFLLIVLAVVLRDWVECLRQVPAWEIVATCLAFFPILANFHQGQDAILLLLLVVLCGRAIDRQADFIAGCWLGMGVFKYHLILPLAFILIVWKGRRLLVGFAAVGSALAAISVGIVGWHEALRYPVYVQRVILQPGLGAIPPRQLPNLLGLFAGWPLTEGSGRTVEAAVAICSIGVVAAIAWLRGIRQDSRLLRLGIASAVIAALLVGYSTNTYDLSLLIVPLALVADYCERESPDRPLLKNRLTLPALPLLISPLWFFLWMRWERIHLIAIFLLWWLFAIRREIVRAAAFGHGPREILRSA